MTEDRNTHDLLYMQTYEALKRRILSGEITPGTKLLSKRTMSSMAGISINTVDSAYQQLISEGYVEARPRSGYFVSDLGPIIRPDKSVGQAGRSLLQDNSDTAERHMPNESSIQIDFSPNTVDLQSFPHAKFKKLIRECLDVPPDVLLASCGPAGSDALQRSLSRYLRSSRALVCNPHQIIIGAGTDFILQLLIQILRSETAISSIAMENPLYNKAFQIFTEFQIPVRLIPVGDSGLRTDILRKSDANLVYLTPSHQFPLGVILPISKRKELIHWATEQPDRYIIEDDYDSEFRYSGRPIPTIGETDRDGRVIYLGTFSKSLAPSIRISYLVLPENLLQAYRRSLSFYTTTVSSPDQFILSRFIDSGEFERHIARMRTLYRKKRDVLLNELSMFTKNVKISGTDAGLHLILKIENGMSEELLCQEAAKAGVKVYGISSYYVKTSAEATDGIPGSTVILGYAGLSDAEIKIGITALAKAWKLNEDSYCKPPLMKKGLSATNVTNSPVRISKC